MSYLSSCAGRVRFLLGTPGMVALDLGASLKGLFQKIVQQLESIPKLQGDNVSAITCDLSVRALYFTHLILIEIELSKSPEFTLTVYLNLNLLKNRI